LANSFNVARRIGKLYRRSARVVYPPVDIERFRPDVPREEFFLAVSRFVQYKRVDLIRQSKQHSLRVGQEPDVRRSRLIIAKHFRDYSITISCQRQQTTDIPSAMR
jgi:glycosyltransferase involved in cell wall biosynthesis